MIARLKELGIAMIPSIILTIFFEITTTMSPVEQAIGGVLIFVCSFLIVEAWIFAFEGSLEAKFNLWRDGKIKGIWKEDGLIRQLEKAFDDSDDIRIKVTRSYDLFDRNNKFGFIKYLDNLKSKNEEVSIRFLLIVPCFKQEHVKERYETKNNGMSEEEFLETWYKGLNEMKEYSDKKISLNVRFYLNEHSRWRFYIFSKGEDANVRLFLTEYRNGPGSKEPMYKIIKKEPNIASFMTKYFDELWEAAVTPLRLYEMIEKDECVRYFCGNCEQKEKCEECPHGGCDCKEKCKTFVKRYEEQLKWFNVK